MHFSGDPFAIVLLIERCLHLFHEFLDLLLVELSVDRIQLVSEVIQVFAGIGSHLDHVE